MKKLITAATAVAFALSLNACNQEYVTPEKKAQPAIEKAPFNPENTIQTTGPHPSLVRQG